MKINELISEQHSIEEGIGSFLGKAAGNVVGGLGAAYRDAKQGYKTAKSVWDPKDPPGTYNNTTNGAGQASAPNSAELRQQAAALTQQADQIEKATTPPATATATPGPAGTTYDPAKAAADKLAKGQADQQQAQQQMAATQQANTATNQQDAAIKAAADAAKAKPPFQQTAADKLAIKAAADKGIREVKKNKLKKKKKIVAEFKSNFLGMKI